MPSGSAKDERRDEGGPDPSPHGGGGMSNSGKAPKGRVYVCGSCGLQREYVGALVLHVREAHNRKLSKPEFDHLNQRQADQMTANRQGKS